MREINVKNITITLGDKKNTEESKIYRTGSKRDTEMEQKMK